MYNRCINCIINSKKVNAVYFAIHPLPTEDRRFLAHGVLKIGDYNTFYVASLYNQNKKIKKNKIMC